MFFSKTIASPPEGESKDPIIFKSVVLPDPLGPTIPVNSPSPKDRFISFRA